MLTVDYFIFDKLPSRINQNQIPNNFGQSVTAALVAFIIFFAVTFGVTAFLQGSAFLQGTIGSEGVVQSIMRHGFAATGLSAEPIFAGSKVLTYYFFGLVIPFIETRFLIRLMEFMTTKLSISLGGISIGLIMVYIVIGTAFVWLHVNVKGVQDNVALLMTFIFAIITFELARWGYKVRSVINREMEAATYLHVINNFTFIANKIGF